MELRSYVDVVFALNFEGSLQYLCPPDLAERAVPGMRVLAPLRGRITPGVIVGTGTEPKVSRVAPLSAIPPGEPLLDDHLMALLDWVCAYYLASPGAVLRSFVPREVLLRGLEAGVSAGGQLTVRAAKEGVAEGLTPLQTRVMETLARTGSLPAARLVREARAGYGTLRAMETRGLLVIARDAPARANPSAYPVAAPNLEGEARAAALRLATSIGEGGFRRLILETPPGTAGTILTSVLAASLPVGRQALYLIPDSALAGPLCSRLEELFPGEVLFIHGGLQPLERRRRWLAAWAGGARVVVASRVGVFTPLPRPALLIVEGEEDPSYKSEEHPRFHAREAALERGRLAQLPVILCSSAPSLESKSLADLPGSESITVTTAPARRGRVTVRVADLSTEKGSRVLAGPLRAGLKRLAERPGKGVLFVNRRGVAAAVFCRDCSFVPLCPRCSVHLAAGEREDTLVCRLCGHRETLFTVCPRCGGARTRLGFVGTVGLEQEVRAAFPTLTVGRIDAETVGGTGLMRILEAFERGEIRLLIGTQFLARGLTWRGVGLVGIVDADTSLVRPDFRGAERAYQLLRQVAGLAGFGLAAATVVIQTRHPDHYAIQAVAHNDPELFYRQEQALRREAGLPPFGRLVLLGIEHTEEKAADVLALALRAALDRSRASQGAGESVEFFGPHQPTLARRRGRHRRQILARGADGELVRAVARMALADPAVETARGKGKIVIDVDPLDFQ